MKRRGTVSTVEYTLVYLTGVVTGTGLWWMISLAHAGGIL